MMINVSRFNDVQANVEERSTSTCGGSRTQWQ